MKNAEYWSKRAIADKRHQVVDVEKYLTRQQKKYYTAAEKEIQEEIESLYQSFADQQEISLAEAKHRISAADFGAVNWDQMVDYAINQNKELREAADSLPAEVAKRIEQQHKGYEAQLAAYTRKGRITQLQLKQIEIDKTLLDLYDAQQINMYQYLANEYQDTYYRQIYNVQHGLGFGRDFVRINKEAVDRAILNLYSTGDFSSRLYGHCKTFAKDFKQQLVVGLIRGESLDKMATRISRRMGVARNRAKTLVRTETAYVFEVATKQGYKEAGVEEYEYLATLDYRTSPVCRELDGQVFAVKDARPGVNYPPMHPNCRSTTVCHFSDDKVTQRVVNSKDAYHVPSNMDYQTWYDTYVTQTEEPLRKKIARFVDKRTDLKQPIGLNQLQDAEEIFAVVAGSDTAASTLVIKHYREIKIINTKARAGATYIEGVGIRINEAALRSDPRGAYTSLLHEIGHNLDSILGRPSREPRFRAALVADANNLFDNLLQSGTCDTIETAYDYVSGVCKKDPKTHAVTDLLSALTDGQVTGPAHRPEYWRSEHKLPAEAFAHFTAADVGDNEKRAILQQTFPVSWVLFQEMIQHGL